MASATVTRTYWSDCWRAGALFEDPVGLASLVERVGLLPGFEGGTKLGKETAF